MVLAKKSRSSSKAKAVEETSNKMPRQQSRWSDNETRSLIDFLLQHKAEAGDGANFKAATWNAAAAAMAKTPTEKGIPKSATSCQSRWGRVSIFQPVITSIMY